jgi:uncharacterized protein
MKILVLCDDRWHPARTVRTGLTALEGQDFQFDWVEDAGDWSAERMAQYPLVILSKSNNVTASNEDPWMSDTAQQAFVDYVGQGKGLLAIHSGTAGYQNTPALRALLGGIFTHHPEQCPVTVLPAEGHSLTTGSQSFTLKDEHYFMQMEDPDVDVFVTTTSDHGEQPGGWTRSEGPGRVCVLTPGHNAEVWLHPGYQALLRNAMNWCAGKV